MIINFVNNNRPCYLSLAELSKGDIKGYLYEKINDKFIFKDEIIFKDKAEIINYLHKKDPTLDLNKYINFRDSDGNWIV